MTEVWIFYADKLIAIPKICVYLILLFYSNRNNSMLAKYTRFTINSTYMSSTAPKAQL